MKAKSIILPSKNSFISLIASQFKVTADKEIKLIEVLIKYDMFTPFHLDKYTRERIRKDLNVPYPTLNTSIRRLVKAGVLARNGKNFYVNPGFRGLDNIDAIVFKVE